MIIEISVMFFCALGLTFDYRTNIGFGLNIAGKGESIKTIQKPGEKTSSLKFWSDQPISLIREGSGYWKYIQEKDGIQFLTLYDYKTLSGALGTLFDRLIFRPLMGIGKPEEYP